MRSVFQKSSFLLIFLSLTVLASAQSDSLDSYVQRLKQSKAAGGNETAFMSIGSDFLYAQEYFEAGNYSSAAYSFEAIVRREKDHPYANYQWAMALLKQNDQYKTQQAKTVLATAFNAQPALRARYTKDFPGQGTEPVKVIPVVQETQTQPQIPAPSKGLDEYIEQIKYARSTGGASTAMLTPGLDAFYGLEYFETGEYRSAETNFSLSLSKDPVNPYVNYLKAVSLSAQGKINEAKPFLAKAVAADPALQERFDRDAASAKIIWKQKEDAKVIKASAPSAPVKYGGKLVYGNYTCHVSVWNGPNVSPAYRQDYKGYFALKSDGTYRWLDNGTTGKYSYNATTGVVTWSSGHFKASQPKISKYKTEGNFAHITIEMSDNYRWECGCERNR